MLSFLQSRTSPAQVSVPSEIATTKIANQVEQLEAQWFASANANAIISFEPDGTIVAANQNFLNAVGYTLDEIVGQHHRIFVSQEEQVSQAYADFWASLARGELKSGEFSRLRKDGVEFWIRAYYMPIADQSGKVVRVIKCAVDITEEKFTNLINSAKLNAFSRSQAVIEFNLDGTVIDANENFLSTMGYSLGEIQGQHHSMFVAEDEKHTSGYQEFWKSLRRGEYKNGEFRRVSSNGSEVWIQATYNPIFNDQGEPIRVVKFATDITTQLALRNRAGQVGDAVADSAGQMVATIAEISKNVNETASVAKNAETTAKLTNDAATKLEDSSRVIEKVVEVIQDLADQTNLLALNATIESARAGDAGKSFAVVASEVKDLARQTAEATKNIERSVSEIRSSITGVVSSTTNITESVSSVSSNMATIAAAVEEQSVTMASLSNTASELRS